MESLVLQRGGVSFMNLKTNYLVALKAVTIGLGQEATLRKDDVITIRSSYSENSDYCLSYIYCGVEQKVKEVIILANERFRYAYKNEVKNVRTY